MLAYYFIMQSKFQFFTEIETVTLFQAIAQKDLEEEISRNKRKKQVFGCIFHEVRNPLQVLSLTTLELDELASRVSSCLRMPESRTSHSQALQHLHSLQDALLVVRQAHALSSSASTLPT
ncbi:hypothetical protein CYMTET_13059 [Cymbomonas tetramitiformis]|uniref:Uncharacterized protein n=1 Tax=Cymbomonas tetramitiformis TaxID=36881 RepID=A0AAE0GKF3_9CHLO|nr:hypothetical protein CYMTET_39251 [Cymbomonas tetramitiformis]KAK3279036.1 hypothetical protein CYMTET_13059 [Cymbomonas tetramitiformis]